MITHQNTSWNDLEQIQRWMQSVITHPAGVGQGITSNQSRQHIDVGPHETELVVTRSRALTALDRLSIYGDAYYSRLLECMREEFPVFVQTVGHEVFDEFAVGYLQEYPSRSYTLFELGAKFPHYLAQTRPEPDENTGPLANWPDFLIDLATLELTYNEVFDGPGMEQIPPLDVERLRTTPSRRMLEARFVGAPCLRLLNLRFPVHEYIRGVKCKTNPDIPEQMETWLAITRKSYVVRHYALSSSSFQLLGNLLGGTPLGAAIAQTVESTFQPSVKHSADLLRTWFHDWAAEGFFRALEFAD